MRALVPPYWFGPGGYALLALVTAGAAVLSVPLGWTFATILAVLVMAGACALEARRDRTALAVRRTLPPRFILGRATALQIGITNTGRRRVYAGVVEAPVARLAIARDEIRCSVAAGASLTLALACTPVERGDTAFVATYVWFEAGWRIVRHRQRAADIVSVRVYPEIPAFDAADDLALRARLSDAGRRRLRRTGNGTEFAGLRDYLPGDAYRDIDWKATARRGRVTIAQHEVERSQQIALLVDAGRLMAARVDGRRKLDIAISAAIGMAALAQGAGDRVGVHAFAGTTLARVPPAAGPRVPAAILAALAAVEPRAEEPDYERAVLDVQRTYRKRSLIVVFTDLFDPVASAALLGVLGLLVRRHVVIVAMTNDGVLAQALADDDPAHAVRHAVAARLDAERASAVALLRGRGMIVVDVAATALRPAVLDAYVALKTRGAI